MLTYNYTVSGGRVVGQGANVSWDLSGVSPGTYTITAGVDDGCGVCGKTQTKTITVEACECETVCTCPSGPSVIGPSGLVTAGDNITFTANVTDGNPGPTTYNWNVSQGNIVSGQGTSSITVSTTSDMAGSNVTATVTIDSEGCECPEVTAQETAIIEDVPDPRKVDEFDKLANDDVRSQIGQLLCNSSK